MQNAHNKIIKFYSEDFSVSQEVIQHVVRQAFRDLQLEKKIYTRHFGSDGTFYVTMQQEQFYVPKRVFGFTVVKDLGICSVYIGEPIYTKERKITHDRTHQVLELLEFFKETIIEEVSK